MNARILLSFLTAWLTFAVPSLSQAQVIVDAALDSADILIGEQATLSVKVCADKGQRVVFPEYSEEQPLQTGIEVVRTNKPDTTWLNEGRRMEVSVRYLITSFDSTLYSLHPYVMVDNDTMWSRDVVGLRVNTVEVDTVHIDQFNGPNGPVDDPFTFEWRYWLAAFLLFPLLALFVLCLRRLKNRKPEVRRVVVMPPEPAHRKALAVLEQVDTANLREAYETISDCIRGYLHERFGVLTYERVTDEILAAMHDRLTPQQNRLLTDVLTTSDLVKFAKYQSNHAELEQVLEGAKELVRLTLDHEAENRQPKVTYVKVGEIELARKRRRWEVLTWLLGALCFGWLAYLCYEIYYIFF